MWWWWEGGAGGGARRQWRQTSGKHIIHQKETRRENWNRSRIFGFWEHFQKSQKSEEGFPVFEFGGKVYKIALLIPRYWKMAGTNLNFWVSGDEKSSYVCVIDVCMSHRWKWPVDWAFIAHCVTWKREERWEHPSLERDTGFLPTYGRRTGRSTCPSSLRLRAPFLEEWKRYPSPVCRCLCLHTSWKRL